MKQFTILIGISFMLVGALAYALPREQEPFTLVPAVAGIIMACGSAVCWRNERAREAVMVVNAFVSGVLIVVCAARIVPDWLLVEMEGNNLKLIADVNVLGLSIAFLTMALSAMVEGREKVEARL